MIGMVYRLRLGNAEDELKSTQAELKETKAQLASRMNQVSFILYM